MPRQTAGYYAPTPKDTTFTPDWYQKNMPSDVAASQSQALGISQDQLYKMYSAYAQANPGQRATWEPTYTNQGVGSGGTVQSAPPAWPWMQQQVATQKAQQVLNPQQQTAQPWQPQMPQLGPAQPTPTVPVTPLTATPQFGAAAQGAAPTMNVPQASAQAATPLFSLGGGAGQNWMLPQVQTPGGGQALGGGPAATGMQATPGMMPYQPVKQFQAGGPVTQNQGIPLQDYTWYGTSPSGQGWTDPLLSGSALGAWALGMPLVANPTPSGTPSAKSGVAPVGQPSVYGMPTAVGYQGPPLTIGGRTFTADQINTFAPDQFAALQQQGLIPQGAQLPAGLSTGPWARTPGLFVKAPMPTLPTTAPAGWTGNPQMPLTAQAPANAAQMPQMPITPAASAAAAVPQQIMPPGQPPAAPGGAPPQMQAGMPGSFMAAHTSALADAGRALYAHFGGDPNSAGPGDIANFHTQLTGMLGQLPLGRTTAAAGANVALATGPAPAPSGGPKKMQIGGRVPGRGNQDTVPALLTPGEYVLPKPEATRFMAGQPIRRMAGGGTVTDDSEPPEVRRQMLSVGQPTQQQQPQQGQQGQEGQPVSGPAAGTGLGGGSDQTQQLANMMAARTMRQNAALSARLPAYPTATTPAAQGYAAAANAGQITGGAPSAAELSKASAMTPGQIQGSIAKANMPAAGMATAIGGIGSALAQAAQTYANSIKPWQMQANAIPAPPQAPGPPQLQQPTSAQPARQAAVPNPALYAANYQANPYAGYYG